MRINNSPTVSRLYEFLKYSVGIRISTSLLEMFPEVYAQTLLQSFWIFPVSWRVFLTSLSLLKLYYMKKRQMFLCWSKINIAYTKYTYVCCVEPNFLYNVRNILWFPLLGFLWSFRHTFCYAEKCVFSRSFFLNFDCPSVQFIGYWVCACVCLKCVCAYVKSSKAH